MIIDELTKLEIQDSFLIRTQRFVDHRGSFEELYNINEFKELDLCFVQDNISWSMQNVLRGMHIQKNNPQGKLVRCLLGHIVDVIIDLRPNSKTFKKIMSLELRGEDTTGFYIPAGCAHGFLALAPMNLVTYKCTSVYDKESDGGVLYTDIGFPWDRYSKNVIMSKKDKELPTVEEWLRGTHGN